MRTARTEPGGLKKPVQGIHGRLSSLLQGRSVPLLVSLLALVAVGPWLNERLVGLAIWELLFTLVMLSGIRRLRVNRGQALFAVLL